MRGLIASAMTAILLAVLPYRAHGEEVAVYAAPAEAPKKSAKLQWKGPSGTKADGRWFSDAQIIKIDQRLTGCEEQLAIELFDRKVAETTVAMPHWVWIASGLAVGFAAGYGAHALQVKLSK